jgi:hypothetical protein
LRGAVALVVLAKGEKVERWVRRSRSGLARHARCTFFFRVRRMTMAFAAHKTPPPGIPSPPALRPNWTTWMWLGFAVMVAIATVVGFYYAAATRML